MARNRLPGDYDTSAKVVATARRLRTTPGGGRCVRFMTAQFSARGDNERRMTLCAA